jgi:TP901 family phage tail tape measure protein/lambda family phage tail tape measure protein
MADKIKRLGVGIKLDTASIKIELEKLRTLVQEAAKSFGIGSGSIDGLTKEVKAASDHMKQIKRDLVAYQKAQDADLAREEVAMAKRVNAELIALQKARYQQASAVNKSLTASGGYSWLTGGMDASSRSQMVSYYQQQAREADKLASATRRVTQTHSDGGRVLDAYHNAILNLRGGISGYIKDVQSMILIQARWYGARTMLFGATQAISMGAQHVIDVDQAQAKLLRYSAMEEEVTSAHRRMVGDIILYSRQMATRLPIDFNEVVKAADRLLAAGVDIDTVKASLKSFAQVQLSFPEIEPEKFTKAIVGLVNTFRSSPGMANLENDAQRIKSILDKVTIVLAKSVMDPKDLTPVIQYMGQMSQAAGFSVDQMLSLSAIITNLGSKAAPAARALRGLIDSLSSKKGLEALESIGIQLDKNKTMAEQFSKIIEGLRSAVGTGEGKGMTLGALEFLRDVAPTQRRNVLIALIREMEKYKELVEASEKSEGALDRTANAMSESMRSKLTILKNLSKELGASLFATDSLAGGVDLLIQMLRTLGFVMSGVAGASVIVVDAFRTMWSMFSIVLVAARELANVLYNITTFNWSGIVESIKTGYRDIAAEWSNIAEIGDTSLGRAGTISEHIQLIMNKPLLSFDGGKDDANKKKAVADYVKNILGGGGEGTRGVYRLELGAAKEHAKAMLDIEKSNYDLSFAVLSNFHKLGGSTIEEYYQAELENAAENRKNRLAILQLEAKEIEEAYSKGMSEKGVTTDKKAALADKRDADLTKNNANRVKAQNDYFKEVSNLETQFYLKSVEKFMQQYQHEAEILKLKTQGRIQQNQWAVEEEEKQIDWLYENGALNMGEYYQRRASLIKLSLELAIRSYQNEYDQWKSLWERKVELAYGQHEKLAELYREQEKRDRELANNIAQAQREAATAVSDEYRKLADDIRSTYFEPMKSGISDFLNYSSDKFMDFRELALNVLNDVYNSMVQKFITNRIIGGLTDLAMGYLSGGSTAGASNSGAYSSFGSTFSFLGSAKGNVFSTAGLKPYLNTVVDRPTLFAFAKGAGVFGEDGAEAIMPLKRTRSGNLGVEAEGVGQAPTVKVSLVVNNNTGQQFATRQETSRGVNPQELIVTLWLEALDRNAYGLRTAIGR